MSDNEKAQALIVNGPNNGKLVPYDPSLSYAAFYAKDDDIDKTEYPVDQYADPKGAGYFYFAIHPGTALSSIERDNLIKERKLKPHPLHKS